VDYTDPDSAMLDCQLSMIDPVLVKLLKVEWNLPSTISDADFRQQYFNHMSSDNCVGYTSTYLTWAKDTEGEYHWVNNQKTSCLAQIYCNYANDLACNETGSVCLVDGLVNGFPSPVSFNPFCTNNYITPDDCQASGGEYHPNINTPCVLPYNFSACLPTTICPAPAYADGDVYNCMTSLCYDPTRSEALCTAPTYSWFPDWANGTGLCQLTKPTTASACKIARGTWWDGRGWNAGASYTEELCQSGICELGTYYAPAYLVDTPCNDLYSCSLLCSSCMQNS